MLADLDLVTSHCEAVSIMFGHHDIVLSDHGQGRVDSGQDCNSKKNNFVRHHCYIIILSKFANRSKHKDKKY